MRVVLVRHGETEGQSSIRYYGATDVPLSALGRAQMESVAAALRGEHFDAVYSSALTRSREGARIVAGCDPIVLPGFNEIDFGDWEGLTAAEIRVRDPVRYAVWRARPAEFEYPGGDSTGVFHARVAAALQTVLARTTGPALLLVVHKGVIRTVLTELLGLDRVARSHLEIDLGSIHAVQRGEAVWRAARLDRVDHLALLDGREAC
jgi:broad specificity phosphatase PhoE